MNENPRDENTLPRHPIRVVAERTGVSPTLLRAWERRYHVVDPGRSEGGQRLYSDADVERVFMLKRASEAGRTIGSIAELSNDELRRLPYFKRRAVEAIEGDSPSHAEGVTSVRQAILDYYRAEYPEVWQDSRELVEKGAATASQVFGRTVFPSMSTDWETHPNHIGHEQSPGCWRCHDDEMATADGEHVIPMDCENCHVFLVEDAPERPDLAELIAGL